MPSKINSILRELSQITFVFFGIFWPPMSLVCISYVVNYTFFWPPTNPKCKHNLWKLPYDSLDFFLSLQPRMPQNSPELKINIRNVVTSVYYSEGILCLQFNVKVWQPIQNWQKPNNRVSRRWSITNIGDNRFLLNYSCTKHSIYNQTVRS